MTYRYLCTSVPSACEYAPETAPILNADVCWGSTGTYLKGTSNCPSGSFPYSVGAGEVVDPLTNRVQAYIPLDDACDLGYCIPKPYGAEGEPGAMCCSATGCTDLSAGSCGSNEVTVWCLDGEEATYQNGSWVCYEPEE